MLDGRGLTADLFADATLGFVRRERLGEQAWLLRGWAGAGAAGLWQALQEVLTQAPLRQMFTPGGQPMSVTTSSCGALGWTSGSAGYAYRAQDPHTGRAWPQMPERVRELARQAAAEAGFADFEPDSGLINCYQPGARMGLHQDRDERDLNAPIVSLSLGLPAVFLWGGERRAERARPVLLEHGDVLVWGGVDRLRFHGVRPLKPGWHSLLGAQRINLTLRKAG